MQVKVIDGLSAIFACVDGHAIPLGKPFLAGKSRAYPQKMAKKRRMLLAGFRERNQMLARHDQNVDGRLGMNIRKGVALVIPIHSR